MSKLRYSAIGCSIPLMIYGLFGVATDLQNPLFAKGSIQAGHTELACSECHLKNPGTYRQQIQANAYYLVGLRSSPIDFGYAKVGSRECLACHERPNERHPIYRFQEPRFENSLRRVAATSCLGCHNEHVNRRVSDDLTFCSACHSDLDLRSDPLDVSHTEIINMNDWESCLGCHDFHGNHVFNAPSVYSLKHDVKEIRHNLARGGPLYGDDVHYKARQP